MPGMLPVQLPLKALAVTYALDALLRKEGGGV